MDELKVQIKNDRIYAPLKRQWLKRTPEEEVRQDFICHLVNDYGYSLEQMEQEVTTTESTERGTGKARADIVIWANSNDKYKRKRALIVVECKAAYVTITPKAYYQGFNYASWMHAKFLILTNQKETKFFQLNEGIVPQTFIDLGEIDKIPNAQQAKKYGGKVFSFSVPDGLLTRDKEAEKLFEGVINNSIFNLVGVGGSGKSSLTYLMMQKHEDDFNEIAYVVVNNNIKDDFVEQINKTLKLEFEKNEDAFSKLIAYLRNNFNSEYPNLLVFDINETSDKNKNDEIINTIIKNKDFLKGWKILILSRENVDTRNRIDTHNLNDNADVEFLKELFLSKAGTRYNDFGDFAELFKVIFYNPLLTEQLGLYLNNEPELATIEDIKKILYGKPFGEEDMQGMSADRHDETIISFLKNLIKYNNFNYFEKNLLRHFVLWQADYIGYEVIKDLLNGVFESDDDLKNALKSLSKRSILDTNNGKTLGYKLHGLLAASLRKQIDIEYEDYDEYLDNIWRIIEYSYDVFISFSDCIGQSLCKYEITNNYHLCNTVSQKFIDVWEKEYAKLLLKKSIDIISYLTKCHPNEIDYQIDLAKTYIGLGEIYYYSGDFKSALINDKNAIEIGGKYVNISTDNSFLKLLSVAYNNLAMLHMDAPQTAETYLAKTIEIANKVTNDSRDQHFLSLLAIAYSNLGMLQSTKKGDILSAETNYTKALEISKKITKDVKEPHYLYCLAFAYVNIGMLQHTKKKDFQSAEINFRKAIEIGECVTKYVNNPQILNVLAGAYCSLADLQKKFGDYNSAEKYFKKTIELYENAKTPLVLNFLVASYSNLGTMLLEQQREIKKVELYFKKAIKIAEKITKDAQDQQFLITLAVTHSNLAVLQQNHLQDYISAKDNYKKSIFYGEQLPIDNTEYLHSLLWTYGSYTYLLKNYFKDYNTAKITCNNAIGIAIQSANKNISNSIYVLGFKLSLAEIYFDQNEIGSAKSILSEIKPQAEKCLAENPNDECTKTVNKDINELFVKINQRQ